MSSFEFLFSLYGLLLGLSLAEVLSGFSRAVRDRWRAHKAGEETIRLGWLTPMLAVFLMFNISGFWMAAWIARDAIPMRTPALCIGLAVTGLYYLGASWVFPDTDDDTARDLDAHYFAHRRPVLLAVLTCDVIAFVARVSLSGENLAAWPWFGWAVVLSQVLAMVVAIVSSSPRVSIAALGVLLLNYLAEVILTA